MLSLCLKRSICSLIWRWISASVFESICDCRQIYLGLWRRNSPDWKRLWNLLQLASVYRLMRDLMIHLRRDLNNRQQPFRSWAPCSTVGWFMQWQWWLLFLWEQAHPPSRRWERQHERKREEVQSCWADLKGKWSPRVPTPHGGDIRGQRAFSQCYNYV